MATSADGFGGRPEEAVKLNELLRAVGFTDAAVTLWWKELAHAELDGRTALQAWLAGDYDAVTELVSAQVADGSAEREWAARTRAEATGGGMKSRVTGQPSPRAVVDQWRAGRSA